MFKPASYVSQCNQNYFDIKNLSYVIFNRDNGTANLGFNRGGNIGFDVQISVKDFERLEAKITLNDHFVKVNDTTFIDAFNVIAIVKRGGNGASALHDIFFANGSETNVYVQVEDVPAVSAKIDAVKKKYSFQGENKTCLVKHHM